MIQLNELKPYVEPLRRMINKMNRDMRDKGLWFINPDYQFILLVRDPFLSQLHFKELNLYMYFLFYAHVFCVYTD